MFKIIALNASGGKLFTEEVKTVPTIGDCLSIGGRVYKIEDIMNTAVTTSWIKVIHIVVSRYAH